MINPGPNFERRCLDLVWNMLDSHDRTFEMFLCRDAATSKHHSVALAESRYFLFDAPNPSLVRTALHSSTIVGSSGRYLTLMADPGEDGEPPHMLTLEEEEGNRLVQLLESMRSAPRESLAAKVERQRREWTGAHSEPPAPDQEGPSLEHGEGLFSLSTEDIERPARSRGRVSTARPAEPDNIVSQLERLAKLHRKGLVSDNEFEMAKAKLLGG